MNELSEYIESQIFDELNMRYNYRYKIEKGIGDRVMVDGKIIKGVLFTPSRKRYNLVQKHIEQIIIEINIDIKHGRFLNETR